MNFFVNFETYWKDNICTDIVHLESKKLIYYKGNYSQFQSMHEQRMKQLNKDYEKQEKAIRLAKVYKLIKNIIKVFWEKFQSKIFLSFGPETLQSAMSDQVQYKMKTKKS